MKVIFRLKSANLSDRENYIIMAHNIIRSWDNMKDLDAMVVSEDVEVYVVDSDNKAEVILDDDKERLGERK